jgi:hypothetical protein
VMVSDQKFFLCDQLVCKQPQSGNFNFLMMKNQQYSVVKGYVVAISSLLAGASVVHWIYKPDLTIPAPSKNDDGDAPT